MDCHSGSSHCSCCSRAVCRLLFVCVKAARAKSRVPSDREVGSMPEFSRTSPRASRQNQRSNCESHGAIVSLRVGSARGRGRSGEARTVQQQQRRERDALQVNVPMHGVCQEMAPANAKFQSSRVARWQRQELRVAQCLLETTRHLPRWEFWWVRARLP